MTLNRNFTESKKWPRFDKIRWSRYAKLGGHATQKYAREAVNVLNQFHRCKKLVYVEGEDDVLFWETLFSYFDFSDFKIEVKDGCSELDKYTERLIEEDLNIIIARDSDYKVLTGKLPVHKRLITTYGYSIENTLYISESVVEITKLWIKDTDFSSSEFGSWIRDFSENLRELIYFDVANDCYNLYEDVIGNNCTRYMETQSCSNLELGKISVHQSNLKPSFCDDKVKFVSELVDASGKSLWEVVRGHFLQSAILKFISSYVARKGLNTKLSHDALYTNAIQQLKATFNTEHRHYHHYSNSIKPLLVA
jgi:hypothetical protein